MPEVIMTGTGSYLARITVINILFSKFKARTDAVLHRACFELTVNISLVDERFC